MGVSILCELNLEKSESFFSSGKKQTVRNYEESVSVGIKRMSAKRGLTVSVVIHIIIGTLKERYKMIL